MTLIPNAPLGKLTPEVVRKLIADGWRVTDIAETYGVSQPYVSQLKALAEGRNGNSDIENAINSFWPWNVPTRFHGTTLQNNCRYHLKYTVDRDALKPKPSRLLHGFYSRLTREQLVVEFDPDIASHPGAWKGGFAYRERNPKLLKDGGDEDLIIRINRHVIQVVDDRMIEMWRMPPIEQWPPV